MDIAKVISDNLTAWMEASPHLKTIKALAKASQVGFGTVRRAKNGDGNITVQNLEAIARAFRRRAIDLLADGRAAYPPAIPLNLVVQEAPPPEERELLQGYRDASPDVREIMLDAARRAIKKQDFSGRSETQ